MLKKLLSLLLCFVLVLSFAGCGQSPSVEDDSSSTAELSTIATEPAFDLAAYKSAINNCTEEMYDSALLLYNTATYEVNFWESLEKVGGTITAEKVAASAWEWLAENSDSNKEAIDTQYNNIITLYKDIISTEISGAEASEIKNIFSDYVDAYIKFYNIVCSPAGVRSDFIDTCNSCISTIEDCTSKLDILLGLEESAPHEATTNDPVEEATESATQPAEDSNATMGEKNALRTAKDYLDFSAFSYDGLIGQLEYEGYTHEEAVYAADNCGADWNEQALKCAKDYLSFSAFSYSGLISQLEFEGFTTDQATYGADNCGADWNEQASKCAAEYLEYSGFSKDGLIEQLEFEGFTHEQAVYGVEANGY